MPRSLSFWNRNAGSCISNDFDHDLILMTMRLGNICWRDNENKNQENYGISSADPTEILDRQMDRNPVKKRNAGKYENIGQSQRY